MMRAAAVRRPRGDPRPVMGALSATRDGGTALGLMLIPLLLTGAVMRARRRPSGG
jgi:hypothetical protein